MNIVSLFAGCGGLDKGFEQAGFSVIWANEFDETIHATYRLNHPKTELNTSDIRTLSGKDIPDCDGIIGGPPCQAWSEGGKGLGILDPRGQLFLDYIRIVKEKKPKFFLIENVRGILDERHKESLDTFLSELSTAGYRISYELLNAADYKIPQDRYRVFFIGIRKDLKNKFIFPDSACGTPITLRKAIGDITEPPRLFCDERVLENNPVRANHDVYNGPYDAKYMSRNRVRTWDELSFTIQAQAKNEPQHPQAPKMTFISPNKRIFARGYERLYRRLSVRECARIQTFPDSFHFIYSDVKDGYKMVGNAVPPRLAWYLANNIKKAFVEYFSNSPIHNHQVKKIAISKIAEQYPKLIVDNTIKLKLTEHHLELDKHVLISLVKMDNVEHYIDRTAKIYYTGRRFPSTIALNKLYYFMPYIKGKGVRDLYVINVARVGSKHEVHPECDVNDFRLVFEIEYLDQIFNDFLPIHLNIWRTFTDTTLSILLKINADE